MYLGILGAPGSGKGTHGVKLAKELGIAHISTGDILREEVKVGSALGNEAQSYMTSGKLVPDELIIKMVQARVQRPDAAKGFLMDGFPRTMVQAEKLDEVGPKIDWVISLECDDDLCKKRLMGRRNCPKCGKLYNIFFQPPKQENICDEDGEMLFTRKDDVQETVEKRFAVYHEQTAPLIGYYERTQRLLCEDGQTGTAEAIYNRILNLLKSKVSPQKR